MMCRSSDCEVGGSFFILVNLWKGVYKSGYESLHRVHYLNFNSMKCVVKIMVRAYFSVNICPIIKA